MRKQDPVIQEFIQFHEKDDYKAILRRIREIYLSNDKEHLELLRVLTWPSPTLDDYHFLGSFIHSREVGHVYSIGCGSGLLEWLLMKFLQEFSSGEASYPSVPVTGVEIDFRWWDSSYSPPTFLPLLYVDKDFKVEEPFGDKNDLILFCYFNNLKSFVDYLKTFRGQYLAILGPVSTTQFCAPGPLELTEPSDVLPIEQWKLLSYQPFGLGSVDHIGLYQKIL